MKNIRIRMDLYAHFYRRPGVFLAMLAISIEKVTAWHPFAMKKSNLRTAKTSNLNSAMMS